MNEETFITVALTEAQALLIVDALERHAAEHSDCARDEDAPAIPHGNILCGFAANFYNAMDDPAFKEDFDHHAPVTILQDCLHD